MSSAEEFLLNLLKKDFNFYLPPDLDWQFFLKLAEKHKLIPIVFEKLNVYSEHLPQDFFDSLQTQTQLVSMQNLELNLQLIKLSKLFSENNIEYIAYKGIILAEIAYKNSSLRQFGDIDLLIHKRDFHKVKNIILENDGKYAWNLKENEERAILKYYYEFPFLFGDSASLIEIHWEFMEKFFAFDYSVEDVFKRSQIIENQGEKLPTLSNEDLLIVLCVHGSKHFWRQLNWVCDIGNLLLNQPINWEITIRRATESGSLLMLKLGIYLAHEFTNVEIPDNFTFEKEVKEIAQKIKNQLFINKNLSTELDRYKLHLQMRERFRDKFAYSYGLLKTKVIDSLFLPMGRPQ